MNRIPSCPFCGQPVAPPRNLGFQFADLDAGFCGCGAVYVSDVTGYNRGAAFAEALFLATGGRWELAWDLMPGEDYQESVLERYDQVTHQIVPEGHLEGRRVSGVLYFVRLAEDLRNLGNESLEAVRRRRRQSIPAARARKLRRPEAETLVAEGRFEEILELCRAQPLNLRVLQKLLYHPDRALRLRTVKYLGELARNLADEIPEALADLVKRLLYASADSAASAWGALEAVGEIVRALPERFGLYVRNLMAFLPYPEFRPAALFALWRIGEKHPELLRREKAFGLLRYLSDENPEVRGLTLLILRALGLREAAPEILPLSQDESEFEVYLPEEERFVTLQVGRLAQEICSSGEKK
ncbi:DVU0298 family protein [Thermosulfurimonas sp. F29]|uniref:DVU0298 family protein n=1 Tax=Thermosulfurimonas sp. F29 TaxID=2867247 RepID=UPI001C839329|nr:DVU0298 family protein [Thermosulfurimonas sp. F29]MBX6422087.1 hypothetical protein [Thermosulfurimonas sp. F29]